jgi:hypothetical protein
MPENFMEKWPLIIDQRSPNSRRLQRIFIYTNLTKKMQKAVTSHDASLLKEYFGDRWEDYVPPKGAKFAVGPLSDDYTGGDIDSELAEIEAILQETLPTDVPKVVELRDASITVPFRVVFTLPLFPEDNLIDIKEKLSLITNIPIYRMYIQFRSVASIYFRRMTHYFQFSGLPTSIVRADDTSPFDGLELDMSFYASREEIKTIALDDKNVLDVYKDPIMVVDLYDLERSIDVVRDKIPSILDNPYAIEALYFGHVKKYFPYLAFEVFVDYLKDERSLARFPRMVRPWNKLADKHKRQGELMNAIYATPTNRISFNLSITRAYIHYTMLVHKIVGSEKIINIRNLFDMLEMNSLYYYAKMKYSQKESTESRSKEYEIEKVFRGALIEGLPKIEDERLQPPEAVRSQDRLTIFVKGQPGFVHVIMITDRGIVFIMTNWADGSNDSFDDMLTKTAVLVEPLEALVRTKKSYIFQTQVQEIFFQKLNKTSSGILSMSVGMNWKQAISQQDFAGLQKTVSALEKAGLVSYMNIQVTDQINIKVRKGAQEYISNFIVRGVEVQDYYQYLTTPTYWDRWAITYEGKKLNIIKKISSISFNMIAISMREFRFFELFASYLCHTLMESGFTVDKNASERQIKKMIEIDPALYNFGRGNKLYSTIVQKHYRPEILTEEEYKARKDKKDIFVFRNYTTGGPAYYRCPNRKLPQLAFVPNKQPLGYCLPKCIASIKPGTKTDLVSKACYAQKEVDSSKTSAAEKYISRFTPDYVPGKASRLPRQLFDVFYETPEKAVHSHTLGNTYKHFYRIWPLEAMALALGKSREEVIDAILERWDDAMFLPSLVSDYLDSPAEFRGLLTDLKGEAQPIGNYFEHWAEILVQLSETLFGLYFIIFRMDQELNLRVTYSLGTREAFKRKIGQFSIILYVDNQNELQKNARIVAAKGRTPNPFCLAHDDELVANSMAIEHRSANFRIDYNEMISRMAKIGWQPVLKFVRKSLVYAILFNKKREHFYCSIDKYAVFPDGIPVEFKPFDRRKYQMPWTTVKKLVDSITEGAPVIHVLLRRDRIGCQFLGHYFWCSNTKLEDGFKDTTESLLYEPYLVNKAIYNKEKGTFESKKASKQEYYNRSYFLFKLHVINKLMNQKDYKKRKQIQELIESNLGSTKTVEEVSKLLIYTADIRAFRSLYSQFVLGKMTKEEAFKALDEMSFGFDNQMTKAFSQNPKLESIIDKIIGQVISPTKGFLSEKSEVPPFPNSMVICKGKSSTGYCDEDKLLIREKDLAPFRSLILKEIKDSTLFAYNLATLTSGTVVNPFKFETRPSEIIRVRNVEGD